MITLQLLRFSFRTQPTEAQPRGWLDLVSTQKESLTKVRVLLPSATLDLWNLIATVTYQTESSMGESTKALPVARRGSFYNQWLSRGILAKCNWAQVIPDRFHSTSAVLFTGPTLLPSSVLERLGSCSPHCLPRPAHRSTKQNTGLGST